MGPDIADEEGSSKSVSCFILLGACEYPDDSKLDVPSVGVSAAALKAYFLKTFQVAPADLLDLFGSKLNATDQLSELRRYLTSFCTRTVGCHRNVFLVYVGHGVIHRGAFYLAIASTDAEDEANSALSVDGLASVVKTRAPFARRFIILDCCYAAEAIRAFLSPDAFAKAAGKAFAHEEAKVNTPDPKRGTSLLCAVDKDTAAQAPANLPMTVFTTAFLRVLNEGHVDAPEVMTFGNVVEVVKRLLPAELQPSLTPADQTEGDLGNMLRLFPNPAVAKRQPRPAKARAKPEMRGALPPKQRADSPSQEAAKARGNSETRGALAPKQRADSPSQEPRPEFYRSPSVYSPEPFPAQVHTKSESSDIRPPKRRPDSPSQETQPRKKRWPLVIFWILVWISLIFSGIAMYAKYLDTGHL